MVDGDDGIEIQIGIGVLGYGTPSVSCGRFPLVVVERYCGSGYSWRWRCGCCLVPVAERSYVPELVAFAVRWWGDMVMVSTVGVCGVVGSTASVNMRVVLGLEIAPKGGGVGDGEGSMDGGGDGSYFVIRSVCMCVHVRRICCKL